MIAFRRNRSTPNRIGRCLSLGVTCFMMAVSAPGLAQFYVPEPNFLPMSSFLNDAFLSNQRLKKGSSRAKSPTPTPEPSEPVPAHNGTEARAAPHSDVGLSFRSGSAPIMPARLASNLPEQDRAQAQAVFTKMLATYHRIERQFALPENDLAGATAALLIGSYQAYHVETLPDAAFPALAGQLRGPLAGDEAIAAMSEAERQAYYEQAAIIGTYLVTVRIGLEHAPNAVAQKSLQEAGGRYLAQVLGGNPNRIVITAAGIQGAQ